VPVNNFKSLSEEMQIKKITIKSKKLSTSLKKNMSSQMTLSRKGLEFNLFPPSLWGIKTTTIV